MDPDLFNLWAWDLGVFKRLWVGELKKYVVASFWPPIAMETIQDDHQTQIFQKLKTPVIACKLIFFSQLVQT